MKVKEQEEETDKRSGEEEIDESEDEAVEAFNLIINPDITTNHQDENNLKDPEFNLNISLIYNALDLSSIAKIADRYGVSDQAAAAIATATLVVLGVISGEEWLVITRHKMRRSREALRMYLRTSGITKGIGLYFDGRKDNTLFMEKGTSGNYRQKIKKEEHIISDCRARRKLCWSRFITKR